MLAKIAHGKTAQASKELAVQFEGYIRALICDRYCHKDVLTTFALCERMQISRVEDEHVSALWPTVIHFS